MATYLQLDIRIQYPMNSGRLNFFAFLKHLALKHIRSWWFSVTQTLSL